MTAPSIPALLEPIQKRAGAESGCSSDPCGSKVCKAQRDRARLLAAVKAVTAGHEEAVAYADDIAEGGDEVPEDYERHYCSEDGRDWPCPTVSAVEAALRGEA